jgi:lipoyl(octanoyl) transferase
MQKAIKYIDLGIVEYKEAWEYQEKLFNRIIAIKKDNESLPQNNKIKSQGYFIFCEHPHVYTLGKSGSQNNLLIDAEFLKKINAKYYKTDRGGDITYHGYGQIVGYPVFDLENFKMGVKDYVHKLEETIIKTLKEFDIFAVRLDDATGVWILNPEMQSYQKICAIGVKMSRYVTMHGFALNVNTDLTYFNHINPCGFVDRGVTSIQKELGHKVDCIEVKGIIKRNISEIFI